MPESDLLAEGGPRLSKYARKQQERAGGIRPPFKFVDRPQPPVTPQALAPARPGRVYARVMTVVPEKGCAFLMTAGGQTLYLSFNTFRHRFGDDRIELGSSLECRIDPIEPGKKYPRVAHVFTKQA